MSAKVSQCFRIYAHAASGTDAHCIQYLMCVCVCVCVRARARACVRVYVREKTKHQTHLQKTKNTTDTVHVRAPCTKHRKFVYPTPSATNRLKVRIPDTHKYSESCIPATHTLHQTQTQSPPKKYIHHLMRVQGQLAISRERGRYSRHELRGR